MLVSMKPPCNPHATETLANSVCSPIYSYGFRGLDTPKLTDRERQLHAIVYSSNLEPDLENLTTRIPIAVDSKSLSNTLHKKSRLNLGTLISIQRNVRVRDHGTVAPSDFQRLQSSLQEIYAKGFSLPQEQEEAPT